MHGATDLHGLPVIAMTLQSTKKTNVVLRAPIGTGKLYNNPLITTNGQILFLIQFNVPFKIILSHMRRANQ